MTDESRLRTWMDGYLRAWETNDPADIAALFTEDAEYFIAPFSTPWRGRDEIVTEWINQKDEPGTWQFSWQPVAIDDAVAVIRGETAYTGTFTYSNLWVMRFAADGRCSSYTEWYMDQAR